MREEHEFGTPDIAEGAENGDSSEPVQRTEAEHAEWMGRIDRALASFGVRRTRDYIAQQSSALMRKVEGIGVIEGDGSEAEDDAAEE